jgi:hypothetical protein
MRSREGELRTIGGRVIGNERVKQSRNYVAMGSMEASRKLSRERIEKRWRKGGRGMRLLNSARKQH